MEVKSTRNRRGWLIKYLVGLDQLFYKRWQYWTRICQSDTLDNEPIPLIKFQCASAYPQRQVAKNLRQCLDYAPGLSHPLEALIDWILWGFNQGADFPAVDEQTDDYWYRTFNLGLFYLEPADHFGELAAEYLGRQNSLGYYATPAAVVELLVSMTLGNEPSLKQRTMSVCDPCCGTGGMLLYASNYSLNLYGVDISSLLTKIASVNGFIYVPWLVFRPKSLTIFDHEAGSKAYWERDVSAATITEIEQPSGIKIAECQNCHSRTFTSDRQTQHAIEVINGAVQVDQPCLEQELMTLDLKSDNLACAVCNRKFNRDRRGGCL